MREHFNIAASERSEDDAGALRQVSVDVPRTAPGVAFFHQDPVQRSLERILYIWGIRWAPNSRSLCPYICQTEARPHQNRDLRRCHSLLSTRQQWQTRSLAALERQSHRQSDYDSN